MARNQHFRIAALRRKGWRSIRPSPTRPPGSRDQELPRTVGGCQGSLLRHALREPLMHDDVELVANLRALREPNYDRLAEMIDLAHEDPARLRDVMSALERELGGGDLGPFTVETLLERARKIARSALAARLRDGG
jgi:hypothetical protein